MRKFFKKALTWTLLSASVLLLPRVGFADEVTPKEGWIAENGYSFYYENGESLKGWQEIEGKKFYFRPSGTRADGFQYIGGSWYFLDPLDGVQYGWQDIDHGTYYFRNSGTMVTGKQYIDGGWKYFTQEGMLQQGWCPFGNFWRYYDASGHMLTGWNTVDGVRYYFRESGTRADGFQWIDGFWYYLDGMNGLAKGWLERDGESYYLRTTSNTRVTGLQYIDGEWYYFNEDGMCDAGYHKVDGVLRYFNKREGTADGFLKLDDYWRYFVNGIPVKGWKELEGETYYFRPSGTMVTGFQYIGKWLYFDEEGKLYTGEIERDGKTYFYDGKKGRQDNTIREIDGKLRLYGSDGLAEEGWNTLGETEYYVLADGHIATGFQSIDGKYYMFDENGHRTHGFAQTKAGTIYLNEKNELVTGWIDYEGERYFLWNGELAKSWKWIHGKLFYFWQDGSLATGLVPVGFGTYLIDPEEGMLTGWQKYSGMDYYFRESGTMVTGWQFIDGNWYYFRTSGTNAYGSQWIDGHWYYLTKEEGKHTGWLDLDGKRYYYHEDGVRAAGSLTIDGVKYRFRQDGILILEDTTLPEEETPHEEGYRTEIVDGKKYLYDIEKQEVVKLKGLQTIGDTRYYFNSDSTLGSGYKILQWHDSVYVNPNGTVNEARTNQLLYGIDVSKWNGTRTNDGGWSIDNMDYSAIKKAGVDYVIMRICYTDWPVDPLFEAHYKAAREAGLGVGAYWYSMATTQEEVKTEVNHILHLIEGKKFDFPIYIDMEEEGYGMQGSLSKKELTDIALTATSMLEEKGYYAGIYANKNWLENKFETKRLQGIDVWCAQWSKHLGYRSDNLGMWQYTDSGRIPDNSCNFDFNVSMLDYPSIIKAAGLNGYSVK